MMEPYNHVIRAVQLATTTIPIVMAFGVDPVDAGFIASFARPGGHTTGDVTAKIHGKRLGLLKKTVPRISRVALLWDPQVGGGRHNGTNVTPPRSLPMKCQLDWRACTWRHRASASGFFSGPAVWK